MDCPNCYAKDLTPTAVRCPRCDWLLLGPAPATSSAAQAKPPVTNPWTQSAIPELPALPSEAPPDQQLRQQWNAGGQATPRQQSPWSISGPAMPGQQLREQWGRAGQGSPGQQGADGEPGQAAPEQQGVWGASPDQQEAWAGGGQGSPGQQLQQLWGGAGQGSPGQQLQQLWSPAGRFDPALSQGPERLALSGSQRARLFFKGLAGLLPLLFILGLVVLRWENVRMLIDFINVPGSALPWVGGAAAGLLVLRLWLRLPLVLDAMRGELLREVDRAAGMSLFVDRVRFERLGSLVFLDMQQRKLVQPGQLYRVSYSPLSKTVWAIERVGG